MSWKDVLPQESLTSYVNWGTAGPEARKLLLSNPAA